MEVNYNHGAGLDVHKKSVVACYLTADPGSEPVRQTSSFGTMTQELLSLSDWLLAHGITHVAMESTGEYWKPVYNLKDSQLHRFGGQCPTH